MIKTLFQRGALKLVKPKFSDSYNQFRSIKHEEELVAFQNSHLVSILDHAYKNVPYYHNCLENLNIISGNTIDISRFRDIPLLTKNIIRANQQALISDDYMSRKWNYNTSGGSTGEPVRFVQDNVYSSWGGAANYYYYNDILGIDWYKARKVNLWGSLRDITRDSLDIKSRLTNWVNNYVLLNSFRMSEMDMERYIRVINSYKPDIVHGYAGSLYELSEFTIKNHCPLHSPKFVVSSAETLQDDMRVSIEEAFGTKVYNFYGSREVSNLAGECAEGLMHTFGFWNYIEVLDENNHPVREGEEGKVVVTNLFNYSMPLIRYEIGDLAIRGPTRCTCGCFLPTLKKVTGRTSDPFILEDGTIISGGYLTQLFYFREWIHSFQIVQEEYKKIRMYFVPQGMVNNHEQFEIEEKIRLVMGKDCEIIWEAVDEIPKTSSGKHLYRISYVWRDLHDQPTQQN